MAEMEIILIVDDDASVRGIVSEVLSDDGFRTLTAASGEEALVLFREHDVALVFTDIRMPGMDGITLLSKMKTVRPSSHVIIMTSHASLDSSVQAVKHGAYDYVFKPFESLEALSTLAKRAIENYRLIEERDQLVRTLTRNNKELERINVFFKKLAVHDGLTGLYNHRHFNEHLKAAVELATQHNQKLSLIFVDVDHFKRYNDSQGHLNGDEILKGLAQLLGTTARDNFMVGRWGGEEFVILTPDTPLREAGFFAESVCRAVERFDFQTREGQSLGHITISAGVAELNGSEEAGDLIARADRALYQAKRAGRNQVKMSDTG